MMEETETVLGTLWFIALMHADLEYPTDHLFHRLGLLSVGMGRIRWIRPV